MKRFGCIRWNGGLLDGQGAVSTQSRALQNYPYSLLTHYGETSPEELLGAAHAACFTMSLVRMLGMANFVPEHVESKSDVIIEEDEGSFSVTSVHLTIKAKIPGISQGRFQLIASQAKAWCPISKLMSAEIDFTAVLVL
ncbi:MAG TPA: OsmC family peroxiredoxin [Xanthobacteraceae bacterium]|jgi:osmotically inducible protein OsmC